LLWEFSDGQIGILCAVDVLNEGVDVPDVNLVVFQRVTHSRRIFVQQLGRGLRLADGKDKVVVLDFVNDIRRFAEACTSKERSKRTAPGGDGRRRLRLGLASPSSGPTRRTSMVPISCVNGSAMPRPLPRQAKT
jgi:superfamily II DNA or RNA helicase